MRLSDSVALVTGASSGIGRETALRLAGRGATVLAVARRAPLLASLEAELRRGAPDSVALPLDLADLANAERIVDEAVARFGRLDVVVNNAAIPKHKLIHHLDVAEAELVMRINYLAPVATTLRALAPMLAQGEGVIVNVSSFAARVVPPREASYAASKAALAAFCAGLWSDLRGSGIHVGIVTPGAIDTEIWDKEDEPVAYRGPKAPAGIVADAVLEVIERRRHEITVPRRDPGLLAALALRRLAPGLLRRGMERMDPVPADAVERARERARRLVASLRGSEPPSS